MWFELFVKMSGPGRCDIDVDIDRHTASNVPDSPAVQPCTLIRCDKINEIVNGQ